MLVCNAIPSHSQPTNTDRVHLFICFVYLKCDYGLAAENCQRKAASRFMCKRHTNTSFVFFSSLSFLVSFTLLDVSCSCPPYHCVCGSLNVKLENNNMPHQMYKSEYYGPVSEPYCHSHNTDISMQSNQTTVNGMSYWNQHASSQQQHQHQQSSPNHLNYGSGAAYGNQHTETLYHAFQPNNQNVYQSNQNFNTNTAANGNTNTTNNVSSQDIYQYSPYSGDLLQPEDIFQMDQPIRSANVSSLNGMSASPPATLLDLGSGTIEQKSLSYSQSELSDSYYSLNDDNSTASSHTADPGNCFYSNLNDPMHLHNNNDVVVVNGSSQNTNNNSGSSNSNNNNNNANMISMNVTTSPNVAHSFEHAAATTTTATSMAVSATHAAYYCDTRPTDSASQYVKHSPTMLSPNESSAAAATACDRIVNVNYQAACYANNNNNNVTTVNNNIHENFKTQKRKTSEAFGPVQDNQFNAFGANSINHHHHQHEYYHGGNVEQHLASNLHNLELHRDGNLQQSSPYTNATNCSPILSEYCNDPVLPNSHGNQCLTYYDSETNNLVQLSTNSYEISVVSSN